MLRDPRRIINCTDTGYRSELNKACFPKPDNLPNHLPPNPPFSSMLLLLLGSALIPSSDQSRETVGFFQCKGFYRQVENQYLLVPPAKAAGLPSKAQRLLGYGISPPFCGFVNGYKDPMQAFFGVNDSETVVL